MLEGTVAVASGKGGTGKTTVAVNLAYVYGGPITLLDCDVEEPNSHLFLSPDWSGTQAISVLNPAPIDEVCTGCGECRMHCRFNAIAVFGGRPLVFPELCHSCGACLLACQSHALVEVRREIGVLEYGTFDRGPETERGELIHGRLNVGEAKSPPLIEAVRRRAVSGAGAGSCSHLTIIDAPPGTSCPVIATVKGVDYVVLVTEPTPFGLNDLRLAYEMAAALRLKVGVVINRADIGDSGVRDFCKEAGVPILEELRYDPEVARAYSRGMIAAKALPEYRGIFSHLLSRIEEEMSEQ